MIERDVTPADDCRTARAGAAPPGPRPGGELPAHPRLLCIGAHEPSWVNLALQLDAEGCTELHLKWVSSAAEALALLRESSFDCILIHQPGGIFSESLEADPAAVLQAIRAAGCEDPVIVVAARADDALWLALCREHGELLATPGGLDSRALVPMIKRAIQRVELTRDNRRLALADHRRLSRERDEAEHLLNQQRQIIQGLELFAPQSEGEAARPHPAAPAATEQLARVELPVQVSEYYQELLRTYVIMGSGSLGNEIAKLAELLCLTELSPRQALELHLERVEHVVRGLGNRSTRHVMARADLLALELMIHLGECYQRRTPAGATVPFAARDAA